MAATPDPWRAALEVGAAAEADRAAHPELAAQLAAAGARFGSAADDVAGLLDDVDRRSVIDVDAPVDSSRPVVPQLKTSVRKAVAFVARHLAQQTTVLVSGLSAATRILDERVQRLEADVHGGVVDHVPDLRPQVEEALASLRTDAPGPRRDVGSPAELRVLPAQGASLVVAYRLVDIGPLPVRLHVLERLVEGVGAGGWLAVVSVPPASWHQTADTVTRDLGAPGPLEADTWAHLLHERGGSDVLVLRSPSANVVAARW